MPLNANNPYGLTVGLNPPAGQAALVYTFWTQLLADMAALNLTWLRWQTSWQNIELTQGVYSWASTDDAVLHANTAGINISFVIRGAPTWALLNASQKATSEPWYLPDPTLAAGFATVLASRYNGVTVNPSTGAPYGLLNAVEIGNEEYNIHFTPTGQGYVGLYNSAYTEYNGLAGVSIDVQPARDPHFYWPVLQSVAPAIRAASPQTMVGLCAIWWRQHPNTLDFLAGVYAGLSGAGGYADFANLHFYSNTNDPSAAGSGSIYLPSLAQALTDMTSALSSAQDAGKQIWITEIGWSAHTSTTSSTAIAAGTRTITCGRTNGATVGGTALIDSGGPQETVTLTAKTTTTITAVFANAHTGTYPVVIQNNCDTATQATRLSATLDTARTSGGVAKYFLFTLDYTASSVASPFSLVQYGYSSPTAYGNLPAYATLQSYTQQYPQWQSAGIAASFTRRDRALTFTRRDRALPFTRRG